MNDAQQLQLYSSLIQGKTLPSVPTRSNPIDVKTYCGAHCGCAHFSLPPQLPVQLSIWNEVAAVAGGRKEGAPFEPSAWDKFQWADSIGSSYLGSQSDFLNITKENSCDIYIYIYTYNPCNYGYISVKFSGTAPSICTSMLDILSDMVG